MRRLSFLVVSFFLCLPLGAVYGADTVWVNLDGSFSAKSPVFSSVADALTSLTALSKPTVIAVSGGQDTGNQSPGVHGWRLSGLGSMTNPLKIMGYDVNNKPHITELTQIGDGSGENAFGIQVNNSPGATFHDLIFEIKCPPFTAKWGNTFLCLEGCGASITFNRCMFISPAGQGFAQLSILENCMGITFSSCIFATAPMADDCRYIGLGSGVNMVNLINNTFFVPAEPMASTAQFFKIPDCSVVRNLKVVNNTFYFAPGLVMFWKGKNAAGTGWEVKNNACNSDAAIEQGEWTAPGAIPTATGTVAIDQGAFQSIDPTSADFMKPATGSAVLAAGAAVTGYNLPDTKDYAGNDRPTPRSIGAYEAGDPCTTPAINLSPASLSFTDTVGKANPPAQNVTVSNGCATSPLTSVTATSDQTWLTVAVNGTAAPFTLTNTVTNQAAAGTYNATVTVSSAGAANKTYAVTFTVRAAVGVIDHAVLTHGKNAAFDVAAPLGFTGSLVDVKVMGVDGKNIQTLQVPVKGGMLRLSWDGVNNSGEQASSGVYFIKADFGNKKIIEKTILKLR